MTEYNYLIVCSYHMDDDTDSASKTMFDNIMLKQCDCQCLIWAT